MLLVCLIKIKNGTKMKRIFVSSMLALFLSACSFLPNLDNVVPDNRDKYRRAETMPALDVPPDLSSTRINDEIGGNTDSASYSEFEETENNPLATRYGVEGQVKPALAGEGGSRHLVVPGERAVTWSRVLDFWAETTVSVVREDQRIGLMDTNADAEGYAYRLRMERGDTLKSSEIYLSGQGSNENSQKNETVLRKLADYLGVLYQADQKQAVATRPAQKASSSSIGSSRRLELVDNPTGGQALMVGEDFAAVWKKVGRVLDSRGFAVEDRNRGNGTYFMRYIDPLTERQNPGLLKKLAFWRDDVDNSPEEYSYVKLISDAAETRIVILDADEKVDGSERASRLLQLLKDQLAE